MAAGQGAAPAWEDVQPIFESRCGVCHGCYDAPCQLVLTSHEGLERGATPKPVYDPQRLIEARTTRLFIDDEGVDRWRKRGFFDVLEDPGGPLPGPMLRRVLYHGRLMSLPPDVSIPDSVPLDINRRLWCPTPEKWDAFIDANPRAGMPYATAPLPDAEFRALIDWIDAGAAPPKTEPAIPDGARHQVGLWEDFLNGQTLRERIVARYLYEHWFLAHLYFDDFPEGPFFRIVRSSTPPGRPVDEIATRRPFDEPGRDGFWYRLEPVRSAIVHKTHIVYPLGRDRMHRLAELFLEPHWEATRLPGYGRRAANPFRTFDQIPADARYRFLLDDARYFLMTFIRGPVCRGQVAVDVIQDRFWVAFLDPEQDPSVADPDFLPSVQNLLAVPAEYGSPPLPGEHWVQYNVSQARYLDRRAKAVAALDPDRKGYGLEDIWDGEGGTNRNALLTVFRHFDNASVTIGFVGDSPRSAWILDYPIFERIYYNLVAGFDVFGNVTHQVSTRLYMDYLRMQAEDGFLAFLPPEERDPTRASWYVGAERQVRYFMVDRIRDRNRPTRVVFGGDDPVAELLRRIRDRSGARDPLRGTPAARSLAELVGGRGAWVSILPEASLVRVGSEVFTLTRDRWHTNVAFMFGEDKRRRPEKDSVTVVPGILGSYPNFLFQVREGDAAAFVDALTAALTPDAAEALVRRYGMRRTSRRWWRTWDAVHARFRREEPTHAGLLDLNRYEDP
jgi:hypothetical protein